MDPNQMNNNNQLQTMKPKFTAKDFFLNLGAIISLYMVVITLVNLLFVIIDVKYPQINSYSYYSGMPTISWPVSVLIVFFPILIVLMWLLEKEYKIEPERQNGFVHKWLGYITFFLSAIALVIDLITVIYYFINGEDLTTDFLLKVLVVFVVGLALFMYYLSDMRGKLTPFSRKIWRVVSAVIVIGSILWGFAVIGSPRTQRLLRYDAEKVSDLQSINNDVQSYYYSKKTLPSTIEEMSDTSYYPYNRVDSQTNKPYEYHLIGQSAGAYELCADFNKDSKETMTKGGTDLIPPMAPTYYDEYSITSSSWTHPAGHYCFKQTVTRLPYNSDIKPPM